MVLYAANDTGEDGGAFIPTKRRKRTWEEASDDEGADPEATETARKEAEMEADRSASLVLFAFLTVHWQAAVLRDSPKDSCW